MVRIEFSTSFRISFLMSKKKIWVGIFRVGIYQGGNFPGGNFLGGSLPGGSFLGGSLPGGSFPGGNFPDTIMLLLKYEPGFKD